MARTNKDTKFFIGVEGVGKAAADFTGTGKTYTRVEEVESVGTFGDEAEQIKYKVLGEGRTKTAIGSRDAGTLELTVFRNKADAGQTAMRLAATDDKERLFKVELVDGSIVYFSGVVLSAKHELGDSDAMIKTMFSIGINSALFDGVAA